MMLITFQLISMLLC